MTKECCCGDDPPVEQLWFPVQLCDSLGDTPAICSDFIFANQDVCNWVTQSGQDGFFNKPCPSTTHCCIKIPMGAIAEIPEDDLPDGACKLETIPVPNAVDDCWSCCQNATDCVEPLWGCGSCGGCWGSNSCGLGQACASTYSATITTPAVTVYSDLLYTTQNDPNCCGIVFPSVTVTAPFVKRRGQNCYWNFTGGSYIDADSPETSDFSFPQVASGDCSSAVGKCHDNSAGGDGECGLPCPCCHTMPLEDFQLSLTIYEDQGNCSPTPCSHWTVQMSVRAAFAGVDARCAWAAASYVGTSASWNVVIPNCTCVTHNFGGSQATEEYHTGDGADFCGALTSLPPSWVTTGFRSDSGFPIASNQRYNHHDFLHGVEINVV